MTFFCKASSSVKYSLIETGSLCDFSLRKKSISTALFRSLFLEPDRGYDLAPLRLLGSEEAGVVLRRAGRGDAAHLGELLLHRRRLQRLDCGSVQSLLDLGRRC